MGAARLNASSFRQTVVLGHARLKAHSRPAALHLGMWVGSDGETLGTCHCHPVSSRLVSLAH